MNIKAAIPALAGAMSLCACAQTYSPSMGQIDPAEFGEANRQTMLAQVIDPDPIYNDAMSTSGEHAAQAVERYRTDQVKQLVTVLSTEAGGDGASSGD